MLFKFSAYGFLKNQRYFEPFLYLAFIDKGLTFFQIGILIGIKELCLNLFEVGSGILADLFSRRLLIQGAFGVYGLAYFTLAIGNNMWILGTAMFFFALADSFRTGTHKAMIFKWLQFENRTDEKTRVYGFTRSWSKLGSALAVLIGCLLVLHFDRYDIVFYASIPPCILGMVNLGFYPKYLEESHEHASVKRIGGHLRSTWEHLTKGKPIQRLLWEAAGFEGVFMTVKDYLQPLLKTTAVLALTSLLALPITDTRATVLLIGPVYVVLFLVSAFASRLTYRFKNSFGSELGASRALWAYAFWLYMLMLFGFYFHPLVAIFAFVGLHIIQNLWRPILVSRFDEEGPSSHGATLLSLESQSRRITVIVFAPLMGWTIDRISVNTDVPDLWPLAVFGLIFSLSFLLIYQFRWLGNTKRCQ